HPAVPRSLLASLFSTLPRPPVSTLFPYTTLFRSLRHCREVRLDLRPRRLRHIRRADENLSRPLHNHLLALLVALRSRLQQAHVRDRKSTRLNSSHVKISYAVFCLKKKNNIGDRRQ